MSLDNQDIVQLLTSLEDAVDMLEDEEEKYVAPLIVTGKEKLILFFALQHYLSYLTNNKGALSRAIETMKLLETLLPDVKDYALRFLQEIKQ